MFGDRTWRGRQGPLGVSSCNRYHLLASSYAEAIPGTFSFLTLITEGIEPGFSGLTLTGLNNSPVALGTPKIDPANPAQMIIPIEKPLTSGTYKVQWHAVSVDSHKTQGNYAFSVK